MNVVLSVFLITAITESADCEAAKAQCPGQVGPNAVLITANETTVYKDRNVHNMIHQPQKRPIVNTTNSISDEFDLPEDSVIRAVVEKEKRRYYVEDVDSKVAMVCTSIRHNCESIEIKSPAGLFKITNLSTAAVVSQGYFLAFADVKGDEYQAIMDDGSVFLYTQRLYKMADGRRRNPTGLNVLGKAGKQYRCLVFFDVIYGFYRVDLDHFTAPVVIRKAGRLPAE
ncbi:hypothetical protein HDE_00253 [Halotydeus destructor]|nr:hypothetical protein HDE_00253 [Halotydeus destructor]